MAKAKENSNGKLEQALQALIQAQAILAQTQAEYLTQKAQSDKEAAEIRRDVAEIQKRTEKTENENAARNRAIDVRFERIEAILLEHNQILRFLADKVGEKIGFKTQKTPASES